jgi:hypothetical protein
MSTATIDLSGTGLRMPPASFVLAADPVAKFPEEAKCEDRWLVYKLVHNEKTGKNDKIPYNPTTGKKANDPKQGVAFRTAAAKIGDYNGLGFYVESPYIVIDIDSCIVDGAIMEQAAAIVRELNSYTEVSPSGTGLHVFVEGEKPGTACRRGIEIYSTKRFITITGNHVDGTPATIEARDIKPIYDRMLRGDFTEPGTIKAGESEDSPVSKPSAQIQTGTSVTTKRVLLSTGKIVSTKPFIIEDEFGNKLRYGSQSEADLALATCLAFEFEGDATQINDAFRESSLYRPKWDRQDYSIGTIQKAVKDYEASEALKNTPIPQPVAIERPYPMHDDAFYGVAGDFVRTVLPETEADPVALLGNFLIAAGLLFGRNAWTVADGKQHFPVEYLLMTGKSGVGRKGTATGRVLPVMSQAKMFFDDCVLSGLSTGEGLIKAIEPKDGENTSERVFLAVIQEFASLLTVMKRDGNTMSAILRESFDGGRLRVLTRKDPLKVDNVNLGVIAHITKDELLNGLTDTDRVNGFANRFMPVFVERSKLLPEGGNDVSFVDIVERLQDAVAKSTRRGRIQRDAEAKAVWKEHYKILTRERSGLVGALESRAETHVLRLSLIYALLDGADAIRVEHLKAALAFWEYVERSIEYVFQGASGDSEGDKIIAAMAQGPLTKKEISRVFGDHRTAEWIEIKIESLVARGSIVKTTKQTGNGVREAWGKKEQVQ